MRFCVCYFEHTFAGNFPAQMEITRWSLVNERAKPHGFLSSHHILQLYIFLIPQTACNIQGDVTTIAGRFGDFFFYMIYCADPASRILNIHISSLKSDLRSQLMWWYDFTSVSKITNHLWMLQRTGQRSHFADGIGRKHQERPSSHLFRPFGCTFVASNCCASWAWRTPKYVDGVGFYYVLDLRIILIAKSVDLTFTAQKLKDKNSPPWVVNSFHQPRQPPCVFFQSFWSPSLWFIVLQMPSAVGRLECNFQSYWVVFRGTRRLDNMVTWWWKNPPKICNWNEEQDTHDFSGFYMSSLILGELRCGEIYEIRIFKLKLSVLKNTLTLMKPKMSSLRFSWGVSGPNCLEDVWKRGLGYLAL